MVTKEAPEVADTATKDDTPNDVILTDEIELTVVNSSETATEEAPEAADTPTKDDIPDDKTKPDENEHTDAKPG